MMDYVVYLRVSTSGQAIKGFGLDVQEQQCREWIEANGGGEIVAVIRDEGVSGLKESLERPGLAEAIGLLEDGNANVIIASSMSRYGRTLTVQEHLLQTAWAAGAAVVTAEDGEVPRDDPYDGMRKLVRQITGAVFEYERTAIVNRLRLGRAAKKKQGGHAVGRYPFGLSKEGPVEREQMVIGVAMALRNTGHTYKQVADELNRRGPEFAPRSGTWHVSGIQRITADQKGTNA